MLKSAEIMVKYLTAICLAMLIFPVSSGATDIPLEYMRILLEKPKPFMSNIKLGGINGPAKRFEETCGNGDAISGFASVELDAKGRPTRGVYEAKGYKAKTTYEFFYTADKLTRETKKYISAGEAINSSSEYKYDKHGLLSKRISRMSGYPDDVSNPIQDLANDVLDVSSNKVSSKLYVSYKGHQEAGFGPSQALYDEAGRMVYQKINGQMMFGLGTGGSSGFDPQSTSEKSWLYELDKAGTVRLKVESSIIRGVNYLTNYEKFDERGWLIETWYADLMRDGSYSKSGNLYKMFYSVDSHGSWVRLDDWQVDGNGNKIKNREWCSRVITYSSDVKKR